MINEQVVPEMNGIYVFNLLGDINFQETALPCHRQVIDTERLHEFVWQSDFRP